MLEMTAAITSVKMIAAFAKQAGNIEITQQVIDLQQSLMSLISQNTELASEVARLNAELRQRDNQLQREEEFGYDRDCYWRKTEGAPEGPYCSKCFDAESKAVRMHALNDGVVGCPACDTRVRLEPSTRAPVTYLRRVSSPSWVTGY